MINKRKKPEIKIVFNYLFVMCRIYFIDLFYFSPKSYSEMIKLNVIKRLKTYVYFIGMTDAQCRKGF